MQNNHKQILLIEDNPGDARLVQEALEDYAQEYFDLHTARSLSEGKAFLDSTPKPDIILLDLSLEDSRGIKTFHQLYDLFPQIPIVILTGLDDQDLAFEALQDGAQDFIIKEDLNSRNVARVIRYAIERSRLLVALSQKNLALQAAKEQLESEVASRLQEFRLEHQRLELYLETVEVMVVVLDTQGEILLLNRKGHQILDYAPGELVGANWFDSCLPKHNLKEVKGVFAQLMAGEIEPVEYYENQVLTQNGEERILAWHNGLLRNPDGEISGILSSGEDITERKQVEEVLHQQGKEIKAQVNFLDSVMEQSPFAMWISDTAGTVIRTNLALRQALNLTDDQIVGNYNVFGDGNLTQQGVMPQVKAVYDEQVPVRFSISWSGAGAGDVDFESAPELWIDVSMFPVLNHDGDLLNVVCQWIDISERVWAEEALKKSELRLTTVLDGIDADIYVADMETYEILFMNQHMQSGFGGDWVGKVCWQVFRGESGPCPHCTNPHLIDESGSPAEVVTWESQNPVTGRWYINHDRAIQWLDDRLVRLQVAVDITDRVQAEQELESTLKTSDDIVHGIPSGLFIYQYEAPDKLFLLRANPAAQELTGIRAEDWKGKEFNQIWPQAKQSGITDAYLAVMRTGESLIQDDLTYEDQRLAGAFSVRAFRLPDQRLGVSFENITARVKAENEIQELNLKLEQRVVERTAQLEAFAYSVSHDLKAPLRGIHGYSRLLQKSYADQLDEEGKLFIQNINKAADNMRQLIDDLLAYSRMERRNIVRSDVDLSGVVSALLEEFEPQIKSNAVDVQVALPSIKLYTDLESLVQVLRNLIDNAIKFSGQEAEPKIEIGGRLDGDKCIVWVQDDGIGFDMRYKDRIFEIFQRLNRMDEYPGTGIGLAIVEKAMQRMDGRIWVESQPGQGASFYLEFSGVKR